MQDVLYDLHRTEGILQEKGLAFSKSEETNDYYLEVLKKHGISQQEFDSSLVWYSKHPKHFDIIYPNVIKQLEDEKSKLDLLQGQVIADNNFKTERNAIEYYINVTLFGKGHDVFFMQHPYFYFHISATQVKMYWKQKYKFLFLKID